MKYKIKRLNNTDAVVISDEEIKINDPITDGYRVWYWRDNCSLLGRKKIIATISPFKIEGLPMLELDNQEVNVEKLAHTKYAYISKNPPYTIITPKGKIEGFKEGYKAAQKQYREENLLSFGKFCIENNTCDEENRYYEYWELLNMWKKQQKKQFPIAVDLECEGIKLKGSSCSKNNLCTYPNCKLKVIKWYYE